MQSLRIDVIVPAAGVGKRMRLNIPKQYAKISEKTVLEHTVQSLLSSPYVNNVIIGISPQDEYFDSIKWKDEGRIIRGEGGAERSDTVRLNIPLVKTEYVMVHDAARPMLSAKDIGALAVATENNADGAILACRVADTLKEVKDGVIVKTVPRENIYRAYTPQLFKTRYLADALDNAYAKGLTVTDDASAMELSGFKVQIVEGRADNFKLTTPEDLIMARLLLEMKE
ncbi:MAG: 2-C-methyl-D-erythritol 4-phosphate cytidylyltransferase [Succinivibrio sp.]